jgi:hypothetical protein
VLTCPTTSCAERAIEESERKRRELEQQAAWSGGAYGVRVCACAVAGCCDHARVQIEVPAVTAAAAPGAADTTTAAGAPLHAVLVVLKKQRKVRERV